MNKEEDCACEREMTVAIIVRGFLNFLSKYDRWKTSFGFCCFVLNVSVFNRLETRNPLKSFMTR